MNCHDWQDVLQQRLDGTPSADRAALDRHLADCPDCRDRFAAAARLEAGLLRLPPVTVPDGLAGRIAGRVLAERRARRRRRLWVPAGAAAAAGLLLAIFLIRGRPAVDTPPVATTGTPAATDAAPPDAESLSDRVASAGSAVVGLTRRTADETVGQGKLLLPVVTAPPDLGTGRVPDPMEPPMRSLRAAGQGVSEGLEPVTTSARRAVDLFLNELPPMESDAKRGT